MLPYFLYKDHDDYADEELMKKIFMSLLFCSTSLFAITPVATVKLLKGNVVFNGKKLKAGDAITQKGKISVAEKSFLKLELNHSSMTFSPGTEVEIDPEQNQKTDQLSLVKGMARWLSTAHENKGENPPGFRTKGAAMGVRGTDFIIIANPLLGETEIVNFDGMVEFQNMNDDANKILIKKGQWGGLGGRFGGKIAPVIDLTPEILHHFNGALAK